MPNPKKSKGRKSKKAGGNSSGSGNGGGSGSAGSGRPDLSLPQRPPTTTAQLATNARGGRPQGLLPSGLPRFTDGVSVAQGPVSGHHNPVHYPHTTVYDPRRVASAIPVAYGYNMNQPFPVAPVHGYTMLPAAPPPALAPGPQGTYGGVGAGTVSQQTVNPVAPAGPSRPYVQQNTRQLFGRPNRRHLQAMARQAVQVPMPLHRTVTLSRPAPLQPSTEPTPPVTPVRTSSLNFSRVRPRAVEISPSTLTQQLRPAPPSTPGTMPRSVGAPGNTPGTGTPTVRALGTSVLRINRPGDARREEGWSEAFRGPAEALRQRLVSQQSSSSGPSSSFNPRAAEFVPGGSRNTSGSSWGPNYPAGADADTQLPERAASAVAAGAAAASRAALSLRTRSTTVTTTATAQASSLDIRDAQMHRGWEEETFRRLGMRQCRACNKHAMYVAAGLCEACRGV